MTMAVLTTRTVAIVGASSGIGLAAAVAAAGEGARVIMLSRSQAKLEQASKAVPGQARSIAVDMLERTAVDRAIASIGTIDHLVLTAVGDEYALFAPIANVSAEQVERSLDKVRGFVNVTRAAVPLMRARGSITLVSGAGAFKPSKETSLAAAANGAIVSFGRSLSIELAPVRVNVLMAGVVNTPLHGDRRDAIRAASESSLPARRFGEPEDLAHAIVFLMTNPYVTGHTLIVDGGLLAS
jgi:NAD(P)-dependent dehydrogenase (short-subunit alcohol dehydrogenase family)